MTPLLASVSIETVLFGGLALVLGLAIGSFANVCIHRIPLRQAVGMPRSRCPSCASPIRPSDNVPVLSWLWLRGRCRVCGARISLRYPLVEATNGLLYLGLALQAGPTLRAIVSMGLATALLILSLIDFDHQILPDKITLPGIVVGVAASLRPGSPVKPVEALLAAAAGYVVFMLVAKGYQLARGVEGLGQGDWKMAAMLGAFFGWKQMLLVILLASVAGTAVGAALILAGRGDMQSKLPLGTFLGIAGIAALFVGEPLIVWYSALFHRG